MNVLVLNCGSSSAKFAVIDAVTGREIVSGIAQRLGSAQASLDFKADGHKESRLLHGAGHEAALRAVVALLEELGVASAIAGVGHRVVHGGAKFSGSMFITPDVLERTFGARLEVLEHLGMPVVIDDYQSPIRSVG